MTSRFTYRTSKCIMCGNYVEETIFNGPTHYGFHDLDLRPTGILRIAMPHLIHYCPKCGYASPKIDTMENEKIKEFVASKQYIEAFKKLKESTGKPFILYGLILKELGQTIKAGHTFLRAAWMFDDQKKEKIARTCRLIAINLIERNVPLRKEHAMMLIDMKRRTGNFYGALDAMEFYSDKLKGGMRFEKQWAAFERKLCYEKDARAYSIKDMMNDGED